MTEPGPLSPTAIANAMLDLARSRLWMRVLVFLVLFFAFLLVLSLLVTHTFVLGVLLLPVWVVFALILGAAWQLYRAEKRLEDWRYHATKEWVHAAVTKDAVVTTYQGEGPTVIVSERP
jgi:hypothetical protein